MGQGMPEGQNQAVLNPESRSQGSQPQGGELRRQAQETAAEGLDHPTLQRAEELVDHLGERIGHFAHTLSLRFRKATARAREEVQDIWAEAQHIKTRGRS
jgi:hypothetical protein